MAVYGENETPEFLEFKPSGELYEAFKRDGIKIVCDYFADLGDVFYIARLLYWPFAHAFAEEIDCRITKEKRRKINETFSKNIGQIDVWKEEFWNEANLTPEERFFAHFLYDRNTTENRLRQELNRFMAQR